MKNAALALSNSQHKLLDEVELAAAVAAAEEKAHSFNVGRVQVDLFDYFETILDDTNNLKYRMFQLRKTN